MIRKALALAFAAAFLAACATCLPTPEERAATAAQGPDAVKVIKAPGS